MSVFFPFTHSLSVFEINITFVHFEGEGENFWLGIQAFGALAVN